MTDNKDTPPQRSCFTDEQIRKAILRRLAGESRETIALSYRTSSYREIIGNTPKPKGSKRVKPSKLTDEAKAEILTLIKFLHDAEIAELYGVTVHMVTHFLRRIRPAEGWGKRPASEGCLTDLQKVDVVARWRKGETLAQIATRYGVTSPAIHYVIKREIPAEAKRKRTRRGKLSEKQKQQAIERRRNGETLAAIGKSYNTSAVAIYKATCHAAPPEGWPQNVLSKKESE